jgi:hypothetical protein
MTAERQKRLILCSLLICGEIVCMAFSFHRSRYQTSFRLALNILFLITFWLAYRRNLNRRQPDTLIHLFPVPPETQGKI